MEPRLSTRSARSGSLDVLVNNAGIALYDDLSKDDTIGQQLEVNFFGPLHLIRAVLPALKKSRGAILNNLSMAAIAPMPVVSGYSISKAAAFNMTQLLRALLSSEGVTVHSVVLGPVDADMNRGYNIPKATTESAAVGIFDGLQNGEDYVFPDPASQSIAEDWRNGVAYALERQIAALPPAAEVAGISRKTREIRREEIKKMTTQLRHKTGSREEWLAARLELLKAEKELTRRSDEVARQRQELPWVPIDKEYRFDTEEGSASLSDLFRGRSQLLVYHFMFGPDFKAGCPSCSSIADGFNGIVSQWPIMT